MTPETEAEFLKELKKMNGFLEAIDWKLWNMHKKFIEDGVVPTAERAATVATASAPVAKSTTEDAGAGVAIPAIPKYPSIEKWSS